MKTNKVMSEVTVDIDIVHEIDQDILSTDDSFKVCYYTSIVLYGLLFMRACYALRMFSSGPITAKLYKVESALIVLLSLA